MYIIHALIYQHIHNVYWTYICFQAVYSHSRMSVCLSVIKCEYWKHKLCKVLFSAVCVIFKLGIGYCEVDHFRLFFKLFIPLIRVSTNENFSCCDTCFICTLNIVKILLFRQIFMWNAIVRISYQYALNMLNQIIHYLCILNKFNVGMISFFFLKGNITKIYFILFYLLNQVYHRGDFISFIIECFPSATYYTGQKFGHVENSRR